MLLEDGEYVEPGHLQLGVEATARGAEGPPATPCTVARGGRIDDEGIPFEERVDQIERGLIARAFEISGGNQTRAAELLRRRATSSGTE